MPRLRKKANSWHCSLPNLSAKGPWKAPRSVPDPVPAGVNATSMTRGRLERKMMMMMMMMTMMMMMMC